jgi:precorrin-2 dehydrogenase / sirohydrochlorin ferrochelatase
LGTLVNVVDRPALCTFTLPAVVRQGDFEVAISTEGQCPALASVLREYLSHEFGPEYDPLVRLLGEIRREMIAQGRDGAAIRHAVQRLHESGIAEMIRTQDRPAIERLIRSCLGDEFPLPATLDAV